MHYGTKIVIWCKLNPCLFPDLDVVGWCGVQSVPKVPYVPTLLLPTLPIQVLVPTLLYV